MNKDKFKKLISKKILILDGAMGTELHKRNLLKNNKAPEELNIICPNEISQIHKSYLDAGSDIILSNTFGANRYKLKEYNLEHKLSDINQTGIKIAKEMASQYNALVAADIGPIGSYLEPLGSITFDQAYDIFAEQVKALVSEDPDLIVIETMAEIREVKAALLAVKDNSNCPVAVQMTFTSDGTTVTGTDVLSFACVAESMGADIVGMNCSVGPKELFKLAKLLSKNTNLPISFKPNAGMPQLINRQTVFPGTIKDFVRFSAQAYDSGVNLLGGCCGTNPDYINALSKLIKNKKPKKRNTKKYFFISSRIKTLNIYDKKGLIIIGERINPTNRKSFQEELFSNNFSTIRKEAKEQFKSGADVLDINLGLPGADEKRLMAKAVMEIQDVVSIPLCLDSSSSDVLEAGLKSCAGRPIINSVTGDKKKLEQILPLAKRFGAALIGLTTDEKGIPKTAKQRLAIAKKIVSEAKKYGIADCQIIIDYLTLSASAMQPLVKETLSAIRTSKKLLPKVKTVLGVSNVSFGLPNRHIINSTFLKLAQKAGLDFAILNPNENRKIDNKLAKDLLLNKDKTGKKYIEKYSAISKKPESQIIQDLPIDQRLYISVIEGNIEEISFLIDKAINSGISLIDIANNILLRSLSEVGEKFNKKEYFLPQVIRSAEAAQLAFSKIKPLLHKQTGFASGKIILATVKDDMHDIGKNIVAAVLESHGWEVIDLGKNVEVSKIIETVKKENVHIVGLSALMTTTMLEMEKFVQEKNAQGINVKVLIGGAPVTEKYAKQIGADGYAKDAIQAPQIAKLLLGVRP